MWSLCCSDAPEGADAVTADAGVCSVLVAAAPAAPAVDAGVGAADDGDSVADGAKVG